MIDLGKTAHHKVYRTELVSDTLVVELQGDSPGFSVGSVHNEMATVIGLSKSPEVRNLIIDMSGSNYYGSVILGEIVNLGLAVRGNGGRIALAGISDDMKEVLRMMRLDGMWERYPTLEMALRALADRIPWTFRVKPYVKPVASMAAAALLLALILWFPRPDPAPYNYQVMTKLWDEAVELRRHNASESEWNLFLAKAKPRLAEIAARLEKVYRNEAARSLLFVARDHAPIAFEHHLDPADEDTIAAEFHLETCKAYLNPSQPPIAPPDVSVGVPGSAPPGSHPAMPSPGGPSSKSPLPPVLPPAIPPT